MNLSVVIPCTLNFGIQIAGDSLGQLEERCEDWQT